MMLLVVMRPKLGDGARVAISGEPGKQIGVILTNITRAIEGSGVKIFS